MLKWKNILMLTIFASFIVLVSACGDSDSDSSSKDEVYNITMASPSNLEDSNVKAFLEFKDIVENKSDGQIEVNVAEGGQLGGNVENMDSMQSNNLEMAEINSSVLANYDDNFLVLGLPYIANSIEEMTENVDKVGDKLSDKLEEKTGLLIVGWMVRSPRDVYSSKGPIESPDDFEGLKIRVMESDVMNQTMELLGAKPTPIAADERYQALQSGAVDAAENSIPIILTEKEYEVTDYLSETAHFGNVNAIVMDSKFLDELPDNLQEIVLDAGKEAAKFAIEDEKKQIKEAKDELKENGMEINNIEDITPFQEIVEPVYENNKDRIDEDIYEAIMGND